MPDRGDSDYYHIGLEHKRKTGWSQALQFWLQSGKILQRQQKSDPRIGVAFIELATQQKAAMYYELACDMYFWGFSQETLPEYRKELENEVERISPLLLKDELKRWRLLLDKNLSLLNMEIKSFWLKKDPTPSTSINERLLEHWERIAHARRNFKKARNTVYGTDDRGIVYVKYGRPNRIDTGILGANRSQLKRWTDIILESNTSRVVGGENSVPAFAAEQTFLVEAIDRFNNFPEYEIWFYYSLLSDEPVFFIFGNREGIGVFGLRSGVEEFIPSRAFLRSSTRNTNGILPGAVLQSLYYSQLMHLNPYFEDRYYDLEDVWAILDSDRPNASHVNATFNLKRTHYQSMDRNAPVHANAPVEKSDFIETVSEVDLVVQSFRFLDEKNSPKIAMITFAYPKIKAEFVNLAAGDIFPTYSSVHTLIALNSKNEETRRLTVHVPFGQENVSTFILPHLETQDGYMITAEVFYSEDDKVARLNSAKTAQRIIGLGKETVPAITPLAGSGDKLELSDLLIGLDTRDYSERELLQFPLIPSNKMWVGDSLQIYLEIYHLYFDSQGLAHYRMDFEVTRLQGKKKDKEQSIALSFYFDSAQRTSKENFKVDLSKLTPGSYELTVKVTDDVSSQERERSAFFELIQRR